VLARKSIVDDDYLVVSIEATKETLTFIKALVDDLVERIRSAY
jgi:hypothetical protein